MARLLDLVYDLDIERGFGLPRLSLGAGEPLRAAGEVVCLLAVALGSGSRA